MSALYFWVCSEAESAPTPGDGVANSVIVLGTGLQTPKLDEALHRTGVVGCARERLNYIKGAGVDGLGPAAICRRSANSITVCAWYGWYTVFKVGRHQSGER